VTGRKRAGADPDGTAAAELNVEEWAATHQVAKKSRGRLSGGGGGGGGGGLGGLLGDGDEEDGAGDPVVSRSGRVVKVKLW
jgi:hypothetical protein